MEVKIKKIKTDASIPKKGSEHAAAYDLFACGDPEIIRDGNLVNLKYATGIAMEIPDGFVGLIYPRSSICKYPGLSLANSVGVIDSDYRGELFVVFRASQEDKIYVSGDRIAQIMIMPVPELSFVIVDELSETKRGSGGFGSTN